MNNVIRTAGLSFAGIGIAVSAVACSPHSSSSTDHHITASQSATAKNLAKCLPAGALQQIALAKSLSTHAGRENLINACGIPAKNKDAFEASVLSAAESGHLTTSSGRDTFFNVTLPHLIEVNQGS